MSIVIFRLAQYDPSFESPAIEYEGYADSHMNRPSWVDYRYFDSYEFTVLLDKQLVYEINLYRYYSTQCSTKRPNEQSLIPVNEC